MDKNKRYELLVKLSDFYVKEVKNKLGVYNEAIKIANTAISLQNFGIAGTILIFIALFPVIINPKFIILYLIIFIMVISYGFLLSHFIMPQLENRDKANQFQVFQYCNDGKTVLPQSVDEVIKKHLMSRFVRLFGDFDWNQNYTSKKYGSNQDDYNFLQSLKIINSLFILFDDCIWGEYLGVKLRILEANTSLFQTKTIAVLIVATVLAAIGVPHVLIMICPIFILFANILPYVIVAVITGFVVLKSAFNKSFRGVFVEIDMNKNFEGHTFVLEKDDYRNKAAAKLQGYELVKLEDPEFEKQYAVYSQSQIEARYILTTAFMERIKAIKDTYKAKYVRVAFKDNKIVVAIHTGRDMFKMAGEKDMTKETFLQLFNEVASVLDLVETLKLNERTGL